VIRRLPILSTIIVLLAVAAMIGLGTWQLQRKAEKEALITIVRANPAMTAISFPAMAPVDPQILFRQSSVHCLRVVGWRDEAGRAADGVMGSRYIAQCATGAEGPGVLINMGVGPRPGIKQGWNGGQVAGWIAEEPDHRSLIARLLEKTPPLRPMLIARVPAPGLKAAAPPRVDDIPNNHLAYAVQWFVFAGIALVIYFLAVRKQLALPEHSPPAEPPAP
jgi:cytochrome oxidase assembly protein ShyY1